jgi:hypothetical protein
VLHLNLKNQMRIPHSGATQPLGLRWGFEAASTQPAITPPSTGMIFPVMADSASEQRKSTTDVSVKI